VKGVKEQVMEGKTPVITIDQARTLLASVDTGHVVGLRDRVGPINDLESVSINKTAARLVAGRSTA
jgi:hypothetical protein